MNPYMEEISEQNKLEMQALKKRPFGLTKNGGGRFPVLTESVKGIAHDMRNFLTAIAGYLELVKMEPTKKNLIDNALKSVRLATDLNLRLLNPMGKEPIKVNVVSVIEKTTIAIIGSSNVEFSLSMYPDLNDLIIDELLLERALQNIFVNSIQAMPEGGTINVSTCNIDQGDLIVPSLNAQKYVQISIKDSGTGIPEKYIRMIMEPNFSTKTDSSGLGLGLAIAKEIISSLNGTIDVASEDGFGTMVVLYLPVENKK